MTTKPNTYCIKHNKLATIINLLLKQDHAGYGGEIDVGNDDGDAEVNLHGIVTEDWMGTARTAIKAIYSCLNGTELCPRSSVLHGHWQKWYRALPPAECHAWTPAEMKVTLVPQPC